MSLRISGYFMFVIGLLLIVFSCKEDRKNITVKQEQIIVPSFDKNRAFSYVQKQVDFGPRVPNSEAHRNCKNWMVEEMSKTGWEVIEQDFEAVTYDKKTLQSTNIIVRYQPKKKKRVLLMAHWDTRFMSDQESDASQKSLPVDGADDGASGVAVLMEIMHAIQSQSLDLGVDFVFFDAEDQGQTNGGKNASWCLGAQYWAKNPHIPGYRAEYGILLDMVGSRNARFLPEYWSSTYAPHINVKVWKTAYLLGYSNLFVKGKPRSVLDDHYYVNTIINIPSIDIINTSDQTPTGFGAHWHTQKDNMSIIDKNTLKSVGNVILNVLYKEAKGKI